MDRVEQMSRKPRLTLLLVFCAVFGGEGVVNNVSVYQLTESGLALQATIKGTKFWRDGNLN